MRPLPILLLLAALCGAAVFLSADAAARKDDLYHAGQRDIDAGRWSEAIDKFGQVAKKGGADADGALYWKAYAESKAGREQQALATLRQLSGSYAKSSWLDDARALEVEIRGGSGGGGGNGAGSDDEELKLYALNGLLASDPDRAVPMLQKFLQGNHSPKLKEQALFVLSQGNSAAAHDTLLAVARGTSHPELQRKAVEYLGIAGGEENLRALDEVYRGGSRPEIKRDVLSAWLIANRPARVFAVAQDGKDPLRGEAISTLGAMGAEGELRQIYRAEASPEVRMRVLDALGVAGDVDTLVDIARTEKDPALRRKAIQALGVSGGTKAAGALRSMYSAASDAPTRHAVIEALFSQNNARGLIEIFRAEKDREVRREIVQYLTMMHSEEASQFLEKIYSN